MVSKVFRPGFLSFSLFLLIFIAPFHVRASSQVEAEYKQELEESLTMQSGFDFSELRDLYVKQPDYSPYSLRPIDDFAMLNTRIAQQPSSAEVLTQAYATKYAVSPEGQIRLMLLAVRRKDKNALAYHKWMSEGLARALFRSGDGRSAKTAYKVVSVSEEYFITSKYFRKGAGKQKLEKQAGKIYDVLYGPSSADGKTVEVWFDITELFGKGLK